MVKSCQLTENQNTLPANPQTQEPQSIIQVFDFERNWHLVRPHLPAAEQALADGLNAYFAQRAAKCVEKGLNPKRWKIRYNPQRGPWSYCRLNHWYVEIGCKVNEAILRGEFKWKLPGNGESAASAIKKWAAYGRFYRRFEPQPDTFEWYQFFGASPALVPWQLVLGKSVFPNLAWSPVTSSRHSFAGGFCDGDLRIISDILNFKTKSAAQLLAFVKGKPWRRKRGRPQ